MQLLTIIASSSIPWQGLTFTNNRQFCCSNCTDRRSTHFSKACSRTANYKIWPFMLWQFRKLLLLLLRTTHFSLGCCSTPKVRVNKYIILISHSFTDILSPYFNDFWSLQTEKTTKIWSNSRYLITYIINSTLFKNQILYACTADLPTFFRWSWGSQHKNPFCGRSSTTRHNIIPICALKERTSGINRQLSFLLKFVI